MDEDSDPVAELRYKAWGETRFTSGTAGTDYRYTGQREEASFGLYYYRARWYDPLLGRFAQADTIVPGGGPGAWDRYAYVNNNPLRYSDPTGHWEDPGCGMGGPDCDLPPASPSLPEEDERGSDRSASELRTTLSQRGSAVGCGPSTSVPCTSTQFGTCIPWLGCSGGAFYGALWRDNHLPWLRQEALALTPYGEYGLEALGIGFDYASKHGLVHSVGPVSVLIDVSEQALADAHLYDQLSPSQVAGRLVVAGSEGVVTGAASTLVGYETAILGVAMVSPSAHPVIIGGAYVAGYLVGAVPTALLFDAFWEKMNAGMIYPRAGLGPP